MDIEFLVDTAQKRPLGKYVHSALGLCETVLGKEHLSTLTSMNNLTLALRDPGKYEEAEEMNRHLLGAEGDGAGQRASITLTSMNDLALLLNRQGNYEQAEEMHQQVLRMRVTVLGKEHADTLTSMINLASVVRDQGTYERCIDTYPGSFPFYATMKILCSRHDEFISLMSTR